MPRRAITIVAFLLLGAIVNIAVAWWCAVQPFPAIATSDHPHYHLYRREGAGSASLRAIPGRAEIYQRSDTPALSGIPIPFTPLSPEAFIEHLPRASVFRTGDPLARFNWPDGSYYVEEFAGWPCLSMTSRLAVAGWNNGATLEMIGHCDIPKSWHKPGWPQTVPLLPVPLGFTINTALSAACLWVFTIGPFRARRLLRRHQGLCIVCNYDLRATTTGVCPECGAHAPGRAASNEPTGAGRLRCTRFAAKMPWSFIRRTVACVCLAAMLHVAIVIGIGRYARPEQYAPQGRWALRSPQGELVWVVSLQKVTGARHIGGFMTMTDLVDASSVKGVTNGWAAIAVTDEQWERVFYWDGPKRVGEKGSHEAADELSVKSVFPAWSRLSRLTKLEDLIGLECFDEYASGWPFPAASYRQAFTDGAIQYEDAIVLGSVQNQFVWVVPTRIYWRGALGNLLLYTAVLLPLSYVPGRVRQTIRRRRGNCPACGYNLRANTTRICPECGTEAHP